jgi:hypothetical protein
VSPDGTYTKIQLGAGASDSTSDLQQNCSTWSGTDFGFYYYNPAITNADQGATIFAVATQYTPTGSCGYSMQNTPLISYLSKDSITSQLTPTDQSLAGFVPGLQREDGSYIGFSWTSPNLIAVGLDGSVLWQQAIPVPAGSYNGLTPPLTPLYATADGGAIVRSGPAIGSTQPGTLYTVDQNGNVTSQMPDPGTTYSWKAAYATTGDPQVQEVPPYFDLATMASSYAAIAGGSLMHNGFYIKNHTFGLVFCGPEGDGPCPQGGLITNMEFTYIPYMGATNYSNAPDFSTTHPEYVTTIRTEALNAYMNAFAKLPAIVSQRVGLLWNGGKLFSAWPECGYIPSPCPSPFEHTVYVSGSWQPGVNGYTEAGDTQVSEVFYLSEVVGAQSFWGMDPVMSTIDTANMNALVGGIGIGIGNTAVHEIAWQLSFITASDGNRLILGMGCGASDVYPCQDGNKYVYEYFGDSGSNYGVPGDPAIDWQPQNKCRLEKYLLNTTVVKGCN